jgi:small subunit ribosomal protein S3Ae
MAERRSMSKKEREKWRAKEWYTVLAPQAFNNVKIAEILGASPESIVGRNVEVTMQELTGTFSKQSLKFIFKISDTQGLQANTRFLKHTMAENTTKLVRKRHTKIDQIADVDTLDGYKIRLKILAITERKIHNSQESEIRQRMVSFLNEKIQKATMEELLKALVNEKLSSELYKECRIISPLRRIDIRASEVLSSPK